MQLLCEASNTASDVRCQVCGQGFLVYWVRTAQMDREQRRADILKALRAHHSTHPSANHNGDQNSDQSADQSTKAHPSESFYLAVWDGETLPAGTGLLGSGPDWALA